MTPRRVYRLYDFSKSKILTPGQYYCVSGKVNSADKLYLVVESVRRILNTRCLPMLPFLQQAREGVRCVSHTTRRTFRNSCRVPTASSPMGACSATKLDGFSVNRVCREQTRQLAACLFTRRSAHSCASMTKSFPLVCLIPPLLVIFYSAANSEFENQPS